MTPPPLWQLVEEWEKSWCGPTIGGALQVCAGELAAALRAWDEQIRAGIEKRNTEVNPFGPLYRAATNDSAYAILANILGVPPKEPATEKK